MQGRHILHVQDGLLAGVAEIEGLDVVLADVADVDAVPLVALR